MNQIMRLGGSPKGELYPPIFMVSAAIILSISLFKDLLIFPVAPAIEASLAVLSWLMRMASLTSYALLNAWYWWGEYNLLE